MDLKKRIQEFKDVEYENNKDLYSQLESSQSPHTLFISCSDSRIDSETLLQAKAGEIFHLRNVANIVPRQDEPDEHPSAVSAIEYAVCVLEVDNIIVCGHSNCGGCAAMRKLDDYKEKLPYTSEWISQSISISDYINHKYPNMPEEDKIIMLEKLNAVQQLDNLMTYDFVREKVETGEINLKAYYYEIGTGVISVYDYDSIFSDIIKEITTNRKYCLEEEEADKEWRRF